MPSVPQPRRVLHLVGELHAAASSQELSAWAVNVFSREIGRDFAVLTGFGAQGEVRSVTLAEGIDHGLLPLYGPAIASRIDQDLPGLRFMLDHGSPRYTGRITDLVAQGEFERTALYNEAYRSLQMRRVLGTIFRTPDGGMLSLAFGRGGRDFSDGQTETLRVISHHLEIAMGRLRQLEHFTARREAGAELARFDVLRQNGRWFFTSIDELSAVIVAKYFGAPDGFGAPKSIEAALNEGAASSRLLSMDGRSWKLEITPVDAQRRLVQMERDQPPGLDGGELLDLLTVRELQVLRWIAQGKRDAEIARILSIAARTASKHVENILAKLQCETRAGAAGLYLQRSPDLTLGNVEGG